MVGYQTKGVQRWLIRCSLWAFTGVCSVHLSGAVTAIPPQEHPRLYFNVSEIETLRRAILVDRTPTYAVNVYNAIKNTAPRNKPSNMDSLGWPDSYSTALPCTIDNMKACFSYMIEPTSAKAAALRTALLSWTVRFGPYWSMDPQGGGHIQFALPWMYDLLYNSGSLSDADKQQCEAFFVQTADQLVRPNSYWAGRAKYAVNKEGSLRHDYENWRQWEFHAGAINAIVSKNQTLVDRAFVTAVPEDHFINSDLAQYAPSTRDMKNMLNGLVFPSGYNFDGYHRVYGFNAPDAEFAGQNAGEGQHYHFFALLPAIFGAEAASHNGFDAWEYAQQALRRSFVRGRPWAPTAYHAGVSRDYNWLPAYWILYRHFPSDPTIRDAIQQSGSYDALPYILGNACPLWGVLGDLVVSTAPQPPTSAPTGVTALSGDSRITLSWQPVNTASGYVLRRTSAPSTPFVFLASVTALSYIDTNLINGTSYFYIVAAYNSAGIGPFSSTVSAIPRTQSTIFSSVPYYGDFSNYHVVTSSRWGVVDDLGDLRLGLLTSDFGSGPGDGLGEYALIPNRTFADFALQLRARSPEPLSSNPAADFGVIFGYTSPNDYCFCMFNYTAAFTQLFRVLPTGRVALATATVPGIVDNNYHTITLARQGSSVTVQVDGVPILSAAHTFLSPQGHIGVGSYNDAAFFDDITISSAPNMPPVISMITPLHGSTFTAPALIILQAQANDPDGTVTAVHFYHGTTRLATSSASPFSYSWNNVGPGTYMLYATAIDNAGARSDSVPVDVTVLSTPASRPAISLISPPNGSTYTAPATIVIVASATAAHGTLERVSFYQGTTLLGTVSQSPFSWMWSGVSSGSYLLNAVAYDTLQSSVVAQPVVVSVFAPGNEPTWYALTTLVFPAGAGVVIPSSGVFLATSSVTVRATANPSYRFSHWSGASSSTQSIITIWMSTHATLIAHFVGEVPANLAPNVSMLEPPDGSTITVPAVLSLRAAAEDPDGVIRSVSWWTGNTLIATTTEPPYTATWALAEPGFYAVYASAIDDMGASTISRIHVLTAVSSGAAVSWAKVSINIDPEGSGDTEPRGGLFLVGSTITIRALPRPGWRFLAWSGPIASTETSLSFSLQNDVNLTARFIPESDPPPTPPRVILKEPVSGARYEVPTVIPVTAVAENADGSVTRIVILINGTIVGTIVGSSGSISFPLTTPGDYTIVAHATDDMNWDGWSEPITITAIPAEAPDRSVPTAAPVAIYCGSAGYVRRAAQERLECRIPMLSFGTVTLSVYSLRGTLIHRQSRTAYAGETLVLAWDPWEGRQTPSGIYLLVIQTPNTTHKTRIALVR